MKLLKIYDRQKNLLKNISNFKYSSLSQTGINVITLAQNPKELEDRIVEVYDHKEAKISGIVKEYTWNKERNEGTISLYPLLYDLYEDFITDTNLTPPWDGIFYISSSIEWVLDEIMNQYLSKVSDPILSKGNFASTGRNVRFTFKYASLFEALWFLQKKMLRKGFYIDVDIEGKVHLVNIPGVVDLKYLEDIEEIDFKESRAENIKKITFDNKKQAGDPDRIFKSYTNPNTLRWRVVYLADSRFKDEDSVDDYIQNIFEAKGSGIIEVKNIISETDVPLYSQVNIYNWEKNFGNIYVIEKEFLSDGRYNLKLWSNIKFRSAERDDIASLNNSIEETQETVNNLDLVPDYIQETYIDSVEVRSPTLSGNNGLFSWIVKVWTNGITIDGANRKIFSNNYNYSNKTGWNIENSGKFFFGGNSSNYLDWNGSLLTLAGKIQAKAGSSIEWDYIDNAPINDWSNPDYIKSTYIDETNIKSPEIYGNNGYFSGTFKVGSSGIIIDGNNKNIRSSNYIAGSNGWIIKNDGTIEAQDGVFRGTINATSWELTWLFRVKSPWYMEVYQDSNNRLVMWLLWAGPWLKFYDAGTLVWEIIWEDNKSFSIAGISISLDCVSVSKSFYVGAKQVIQDDLVVGDDTWIWWTLFCNGLLRVPVGSNLYI